LTSGTSLPGEDVVVMTVVGDEQNRQHASLKPSSLQTSKISESSSQLVMVSFTQGSGDV